MQERKVLQAWKEEFDQVFDRVGTGSLKWNGFENRFPGMDATGAIPMWVADMDFQAPKQVVELLVEKAASGIYGYPAPKGEAFDTAVQSWILKRHQWELEKKWIVFVNGVVPMLAVAVQALTQEGDGIIIQTPVYYPFKQVIEANNRVTVNNPLHYEGGTYEIDFEDLRKKAADSKNKMLVLCNPHNPVGRVWSREDLLQIGEICHENGLLLFSDEIHSDLIFEGYQHLPIAALDKKYEEISLTAYSASKTFNLAGLQASCAVIPNESLKRKFIRRLQANCMDGRNVFAVDAMTAAYTYGEAYLKALLTYVQENVALFSTYLAEHLPKVKVVQPQGTYLLWLDFSETGWDPNTVDRFIIEEAKVAVDLGHWFGEEGLGFARINLACPRTTVEQALSQLKAAYDKRMPG